MENDLSIGIGRFYVISILFFLDWILTLINIDNQKNPIVHF